MSGPTRYCPECGTTYGTSTHVCPDDATETRELTPEPNGDPLIGSKLDGRFLVETVLGSGGMGTVYSGRQLSVDRKVAIKVLHPRLADNDQIVKRFLREARIISQISHPHVVSLIDFGQHGDDEMLYLVMEYIDGLELTDLIQDHRLRPDVAVEIMRQACEGLTAAHSSDVVHRDLKPENLLLSTRPDGRIALKILDFGVAHALRNSTKLTQADTILGTVHYMAPEQAQSQPIGPRTDIYALGCIGFELLTGRVPFDGDTATQVMLKQIQQPPPKVTDLIDAPSDEYVELSGLVHAMMSKSRDDRPEEILDVRQHLDDHQRRHDHEPVRFDGEPRDTGAVDHWLMAPMEHSDSTSGPIPTIDDSTGSSRVAATGERTLVEQAAFGADEQLRNDDAFSMEGGIDWDGQQIDSGADTPPGTKTQNGTGDETKTRQPGSHERRVQPAATPPPDQSTAPGETDEQPELDEDALEQIRQPPPNQSLDTEDEHRATPTDVDWIVAPRRHSEWFETIAAVVLAGLAFLALGAVITFLGPGGRALAGVAPIIAATVWALLGSAGGWNQSLLRRLWVVALSALAGIHLAAPRTLAEELIRNPVWFLRPFDGLPGIATLEQLLTRLSLRWAHLIDTVLL